MPMNTEVTLSVSMTSEGVEQPERNVTETLETIAPQICETIESPVEKIRPRPTRKITPYITELFTV